MCPERFVTHVSGRSAFLSYLRHDVDPVEQPGASCPHHVRKKLIPSKRCLTELDSAVFCRARQIILRHVIP